MRRSNITITKKAREAFPTLPTDEATKQTFKNWVLDKAREDCADQMADLDNFQNQPGAKTLDFAPDHYQPLGLQIIIYRHNGSSVWIGAVGELKKSVSEGWYEE